jgi:uncharacterized protein (TIGR02147 family)
MDFVQILEKEFKSRQQEQPTLSLRKFSEFLKVAPATLSEVLNRKKGLSKRMAVQICEKLNMSKQEKSYFVNSVLEKHSKNEAHRKEARLELSKVKDIEAILNNRRALIKASLTWHPMVIFSTLHAYNCLSKERLIELTGIERSEVNESLRVLLELSVIELKENDQYSPLVDSIYSKNNESSVYIKNYHKSILEYAATKLSDDLEKRYFQSLVIPLIESQKNEAKKDIDQFLKGFIEKYKLQENRQNAVICQLSIQLFQFN